jgi:hypothetical protein
MWAIFCFSTAQHFSLSRGQQLRLQIRWGHTTEHQGAGQKKFFFIVTQIIVSCSGDHYDAARSDGSYQLFGHSDHI